jgi:hypothetical protein
VPTVLLAHLMADRANLELSVPSSGQGFHNSRFHADAPLLDYVALGHSTDIKSQPLPMTACHLPWQH